ncbi:MAG: hypothetical protein RJB66_1976 [Pseudomonadota bacterium]
MSSIRVVHTANVHSLQTHTDLIREFVFQCKDSSSFKFRAGQFLMLNLTNPAGGKDILRAYSLASGEQDPKLFRLLIKYIPQGIASEFFWNLKQGDEIRFTGPFGKLFFPEPPKSHLFFMSTGSGLAPHMSYIETFLEKYPNKQFEFLIGVRTQNDFFMQSYLEDKKSRFKNFNFQFVLSRPDDQWSGRCGYLQHQINSLGFEKSDCQFFICGNEDMAKDSKNCLLEQGLSADQIFVEIF